MTWREYVLTLRGFANRRSHDFEHTRAIVYYQLMVNRDPKKPFPSMEKFWPLRTDDTEGIESDEEEEGKRLYEKLQKFKKERGLKK